MGNYSSEDNPARVRKQSPFPWSISGLSYTCYAVFIGIVTHASWIQAILGRRILLLFIFCTILERRSLSHRPGPRCARAQCTNTEQKDILYLKELTIGDKKRWNSTRKYGANIDQHDRQWSQHMSNLTLHCFCCVDVPFVFPCQRIHMQWNVKANNEDLPGLREGKGM